MTSGPGPRRSRSPSGPSCWIGCGGRSGVPIRVLHVTRNPFDNIATEARRHKMSLTEATAWYEQICTAVDRVRPLLDRSELLDVRYETFAGRPPGIAGRDLPLHRRRTRAVLPRCLRRHRVAEHQPDPRRRRMDRATSGAAWNGSSSDSSCWAPTPSRSSDTRRSSRSSGRGSARLRRQPAITSGPAPGSRAAGASPARRPTRWPAAPAAGPCAAAPRGSAAAIPSAPAARTAAPAGRAAA